MKILIIGSKGFIGQALFDHFKNKNFDIFGADIISIVSPDYYFVNASSPDYDDIFQKQSFEYCINSSGAANVNFSIANPAWDFELNTHNVFKLLDAIRKFNPTCKFLQISSAAVYGNPTSLPIKENTITEPLSPYGFHKLQSELLCKEFSTIYGINTSIVRIFSAYGPGLKKQLFWELYQKILLAKDLELFGTGEESRDFIYLSDIVIALEKIMFLDAPYCNVFNIGSGEETIIGNAVKLFLEIMGSNLKIHFIGKAREGDPINWRADISKLNEISFIPSHTFVEGLTKYCKWLQSKQYL